MKVPIDQYSVIDLDAPTLAAIDKRGKGRVRWAVWCKYCGVWHRHGPGEGHREARCSDEASPYLATGYNLALRRAGD